MVSSVHPGSEIPVPGRGDTLPFLLLSTVPCVLAVSTVPCVLAVATWVLN